MEKNENIIDFGSITVPTSWNEINLKTYSEIERFYENKDENFDVRQVVHILCGLSEDYINMLPLEFLEIIMDKLTFLQSKPEEKEASNKIVIKGETYQVNVMEKLKVGEYVAVDTVMKSDKHNYAAILGILCRKEGEIYDSRYEAEVLNDRIKMFEEQSIVDILPIVGFFLNCYVASVIPTLLSSRIREAIDLTRKDIETSVRNGEVSRRSMRCAMKKLRKLEKSLDSI